MTRFSWFILLLACAGKNPSPPPGSVQIHFTQGRQCGPFFSLDEVAALEKAGIELLAREVLPTCESCDCPMSAVLLTVKSEDEPAARKALGIPPF